MDENLNERTWLSWLVKARVIIITFLLGIELALVSFTVTPIDKHLFVSTIVVWYTVGVFYFLLLRVWDDARLQARLQVLADLAFATAVLYATGGIDTSFNFLYPLIIIIAAMMLPRYWAYMTAALSFISFGAVIELSYFGFISSHSVTRPDLKSLQATILINLFAYLAIAYLASQLAAKLRRVDVQLQEKSGALENLQALHEHIVKSMSGGLITTDLDGCIRLVNPAGARLLGRVSAELVGVPLSSLFAEELPLVGAARRELKYVAPDSTEKIFGMTVCALAVVDGDAVGNVYTFTDLTHIRRLEREIVVRDRMAAVGRLASGIAHEIRNPLAAIAGSAQMLRESGHLGDDERSLLDIVRRESERLNKIVTDFLAYSRDKQCVLTRQDVLALLEDTLRLLENRAECTNGSVRLVKRFEVKEAIANVDGDRIKQVFWNICDNAFRAMPDGGALTVSVRAVGDTLEIAFTDTGKGISHQHLENIFEPFHSKFSNGTGLGLAIVYQIIQAHDGKITVQSAPDKGTEFKLRLKRDSAAVETKSAAVGGTNRG